jgi:hypothetical protein
LSIMPTDAGVSEYKAPECSFETIASLTRYLSEVRKTTVLVIGILQETGYVSLIRGDSDFYCVPTTVPKAPLC